VLVVPGCFFLLRRSADSLPLAVDAAAGAMAGDDASGVPFVGAAGPMAGDDASTPAAASPADGAGLIVACTGDCARAGLRERERCRDRDRDRDLNDDERFRLDERLPGAGAAPPRLSPPYSSSQSLSAEPSPSTASAGALAEGPGG
jgi:hypothetical protein